MKNNGKSPSPTVSSVADEVVGKPIPKNPAHAEPCAADDTVHETDRPGFDLGGSSGETHAGTGLGLGENASETVGDRRLPGRRLDNDVTIPRWGVAESESPRAPVARIAGAETPSVPVTKKPS